MNLARLRIALLPKASVSRFPCIKFVLRKYRRAGDQVQGSENVLTVVKLFMASSTPSL
jgi:hypothetical protein